MTNEIPIALVGAGSALVGAIVGAGASLYGLRQQFTREDKLERERRAADILTGVEDCAFALITAIGRQIISNQEQLIAGLIGKKVDEEKAEEVHKKLVDNLRDEGQATQRHMNKQKALARLYINAETRSKIDTFTQLLLVITKELIENNKRDPLSMKTAADMPSKPRYDQALKEIYVALEQYVDGQEKCERSLNHNSD